MIGCAIVFINFYYIPNYKYQRIYFLKVGLDGLENLKQNGRCGQELMTEFLVNRWGLQF
jgi:hypothetical protein